MELSWVGHSCFRLRGRQATVITDPCARETGYSLGRVAAQVVTVSNAHPNHSAIGQIDGNPTVFDGPGEYEAHGVFVTGVRTTRSHAPAAQVRNTAYIIEIDDVRVCHLGDVANLPTSDQIELMKDVGVLLVPVGGHCTIGAAEAVEVISQIEPKLVVPMHYATDASRIALDDVSRFLREMGVSQLAPESRLNVTHGSLPAEPTVALLQYRR
jgi:L-ascorbate metabolism protein UlaG (beta-lactamase superfamily)